MAAPSDTIPAERRKSRRFMDVSSRCELFSGR
jgi:hypothetical protein